MTKNDLSRNTREPSLFPDKPALSRNLFMENKANFTNPRLILTRETKGSYTNFYPETRQKNKPKAKPIKANFRRSKESILSVVEGQNKANTNPMQTQCKPNTNPNQTQCKPNSNPIKANFSTALLSPVYCSTLSGQRPAPIITKEKCLSGIKPDICFYQGIVI